MGTILLFLRGVQKKKMRFLALNSQKVLQKISEGGQFAFFLPLMAEWARGAESDSEDDGGTVSPVPPCMHVW